MLGRLFSLFLNVSTRGIWKCSGQGLNPSHSYGNTESFNPLRGAGNRIRASAATRAAAGGFLTHGTWQELLGRLLYWVWFAFPSFMIISAVRQRKFKLQVQETNARKGTRSLSSLQRKLPVPCGGSLLSSQPSPSFRITEGWDVFTDPSQPLMTEMPSLEEN